VNSIELTKLPPETARLLRSTEKPLVFEHDGRPVGVLVEPSTYSRWEARGDRLFTVMDAVGSRNDAKAGEEVERDIQQAIAEVRSGRP